MNHWPKKPFFYQINTWVWLSKLSLRFRQTIQLDNIPDEVIRELAGLNCDSIWLMGVWQRSEGARTSALNYKHEYKPILPDLTDDDVIGSAYAIADFVVDARIGGREGLARFRQQLREHNMKLLLDYVPNHVAFDHAWVSEHPEYFIRGTAEHKKKEPGLFFAVDSDGETEPHLFIAHGRDPYFPGWIDTAQLNVFHTGLRLAARDILLDIASQCDGVRCDMAMLVMNTVFSHTWGKLAGESPELPFWAEIIPQIRARFPDFLFMAEVYWGMEYALLQQGFDLTYDKVLYDRILEGNIEKLHQHLWADIEFQNKSVRFIENHDEPRATSTFGIEKQRAAVTLITTLPGAALLHDGQFVGNRIKLPVQIKRGPDEKENRALFSFYNKLLRETRDTIYREGQWLLFDAQPAWECTEEPCYNTLLYGWSHQGMYRLIVINLTPRWTTVLAHLTGWPDFSQHDWRMDDVLSDTYRIVRQADMGGNGLYLELQPFQPQIFHLTCLDT